MSKQFVLVVYDISNDRRRTKLHNTLLNHGTPVQYSVFECLLDAEGLTRMKKATARVIKPRVDRVRYYYLCAECVGKTEVTSGVEVLREEPGAIVV
jgi:CRISPR-associated protein Cas2